MVEFVIDACVTGLAAWFGYELGRRSHKPESLNKVRDAVYYRVAVHEAGHTVAAWHDPYVTAIETVEVQEGLARGNGRVSHRRVAPAHRKGVAAWHAMSVYLAGMAGEMVELGNTRSGNCVDDLVTARDSAREVIRSGVLTPPWELDMPEAGAFDPATMFKKGTVTEEEARVLRVGFARAKGLVLRDRERFNLVVQGLMAKKMLTSDDLRVIFGLRINLHHLL